MLPKYITKNKTLKTDEKTWEDPDESESYVKTADPVIQVLVTEDKKTARQTKMTESRLFNGKPKAI